MSQAGRGLNGGIDYVFNFLLILDYISNGNASFYVNSYGDLICHSIQIATTLTVNTITVVGSIIAPTFQNTTNSFSVDVNGNIAGNNIWCQKINNSTRLEINSLIGSNAVCYIEGKLGVNERNPVSGSVLHVVGNSTLQGIATVTSNLNVFGSLILSTSPIIDVRTSLNDRYTKSESNALFLTISAASATYATISALSSYLTTAIASATYATISSLGSYLTISAAAATYVSSSYADATYVTYLGFTSALTNYYTQFESDSRYYTKTESNTRYPPRLYTESKLLKAYAKVTFASGTFTVDETWQTTLFFNDGGVTGKHIVQVTAVDIQGLCLVHSRPTASMGAPAVWQTTDMALGSTSNWYIESFNVGGSRVNASFVVYIF